MLIQVPSLDTDYGEDAARLLSQESGGGKRMTASIERRERRQATRGKDPLGSQPLLHVVLSKEGASAAESVNADMLKAGLARVKAPRNKQVNASELNYCMHACMHAVTFVHLPCDMYTYCRFLLLLLDDIHSRLQLRSHHHTTAIWPHESLIVV